MPFPVDLSEVRKVFYTVFETDRPHKWRQVLQNRTPLRIGSMSDSFMWMDRKYRVAHELLKILKFYRYPYIIATRSDLIAHDDYIDVLDQDLASVQMSMAGNNEEITRLIEPGAPSIKRRLLALKKLNEAGFWTTVRINPMFPIYPDGYYTNRQEVIERFGGEENIPQFDLFDWSFLDDLVEVKVPSFLAGFVRLSVPAIKAISTATGVDFRSFFKPEYLQGQGDKRFSDREISAYYWMLKQEAQKRKLRFNICYIGNGEKDYYQYQDLWSNKKDCCDARGNVKAIEKTSQDVPWDERVRHAPCKSLAKKAQVESRQLEAFYEKKQSQPTRSHRATRPSLEIL